VLDVRLNNSSCDSDTDINHWSHWMMTTAILVGWYN